MCAKGYRMAKSRSPLRALWRDYANIYRYANYTNERGGNSRALELVGGVACHLSFSNGLPANQATPQANTPQGVRMFCDKDTDIKAGDVIDVDSHAVGGFKRYKCAGIPRLYNTHLEVDLIAERVEA